MICKAGSKFTIVEEGRGYSKKDAKKVAAYRVYQRVIELLERKKNTSNSGEDEEDDWGNKKLCFETSMGKSLDGGKIREQLFHMKIDALLKNERMKFKVACR